MDVIVGKLGVKSIRDRGARVEKPEMDTGG